EFLAFFDRYMDYYPTLSAINRWHRYFPQNHVHVGFYDMLCEAPLTFYGEVCDFLGIDKQRAPDEVKSRLSFRINEGRTIPMPHRFMVYLARNWTGEIEQLCNAFAPYPQQWRQRCLSILMDGQ